MITNCINFQFTALTQFLWFCIQSYSLEIRHSSELWHHKRDRFYFLVYYLHMYVSKNFEVICLRDKKKTVNSHQSIYWRKTWRTYWECLKVSNLLVNNKNIQMHTSNHVCFSIVTFIGWTSSLQATKIESNVQLFPHFMTPTLRWKE